MGITLMFMLLATVTPYLFYQVNKKGLAVGQGILVIGMWLYFFSLSFLGSTPPMFSVEWTAFYLCLIVSEVAWIMFIIDFVKNSENSQKLKEIFS